MKWLLYDWGGWNVLIFHWINNIRGEGVNRFMLLGTLLGDHSNFVFYLAVMVLLAVIMVSRRKAEEASEIAARLALKCNPRGYCWCLRAVTG
jgi:hypothetical protein